MAYSWEVKSGESTTYELKQNGTTVAEISGISANMADYLALPEANKLTLTKDMLAGSSNIVTFTDQNNSGISLVLEGGSSILEGDFTAGGWSFAVADPATTPPTSNAIYKADGTPEKWTLNNNTITYAAKGSISEAVKITGLSTGINSGVDFKTQPPNVILVQSTALYQNAALSVAFAMGGGSYTFELANPGDAYRTTGDPVANAASESGVAKVTQATKPGFVVNSTSTAITYNGEASRDLAVVTGLSVGSIFTLEGSSTIKLTANNLSNAGVSFASNLGDYSFALVGAQGAASSKIGGVSHEADFWTIASVSAGDGTPATSATATFTQAGTASSWTLGQGGASIIYTAQTGLSTLAVIEGLNTAVLSGAVSSYISLGASDASDGGKIPILLTATALGTDSTAFVTLGDSSVYKLALDDTTAKAYNAAGSIALGTLSDAVGGTKSIDIVRTVAAGYTVTGGTSISYTGGSTENLAQITGLAASATSSAFTFDPNASASAAKLIVTLGASAFDKVNGNTISISNALMLGGDSSYAYKLSLAASESSSIFGESGTPTWSISTVTAGGVSTGTAKITQAYTPGYVGYSAAGSLSITYNPTTAIDFATITGLNASASIGSSLSASVADFSLSGTTVQLKKSALVAGVNVSLSNIAGQSYTLALYQDNGISAAVGNTITGEDYQTPWTIQGAYAVYTGPGTAESWSLGGDSKTINYTAATATGTSAFVMLNGLNASITGENINDYVTTSTTVGVDGKYTITLKDGALVATNGASVTFEVTGAAGSASYKFALDSGVAKYVSTGASAVLSGVTGGESATSGSAIISQAMSAGYILTDDSITYSNEANKTLATITGLKIGASAGTAISQSAVDFALAGGSTIIQIKESALTGSSVAITGGSYILQLVGNDGSVDSDGTFGDSSASVPARFEGSAVAAVAGGISSTTVTYISEGTSASWKLGGDSKTINYTAATFQNLAIITGLSAGLSAGAIGSISADSYAIKLPTAVLNATSGVSASISGESYYLALLDPTSAYGYTRGDAMVGGSAGVANSSGSANITQTLSAGFDVAGDSKSIAYNAEGIDILATITGLSANATGLKFGNTGKTLTTITLTEAMLDRDADNPATIVNYPAGGSDYTSGYKLALASDVSSPGKTVVNGSESFAFGTVSAGALSATATLTGTWSEGWTLFGASTFDTTGTMSVAYTEPQAGISLAIISGLSTTASTENVSFSSGKVFLAADALGTTDVSIENKQAPGSKAYTYTLALKDNNAEVAQIGGAYQNAGWSIVGTSAYYHTAGEAEKWTIANGTVKHTDSTVFTLATIEGIKSDLVAAGETIQDSTGKDVISIAGNSIVFNSGALGTTDITLTNGKDSAGTYQNYTLALDGTDEAIKAPGPLDDLKVTLTGTNTKTAKITGTVIGGYSLAVGGASIVYTAPQENLTLVTVTGLASTAAEENIAAVAVDSDGNEANGNDGKKLEIQLAKGSVGSTTVTLSEQDIGTLGTSYAAAFKFTGEDADVPVGESGITLGFKDSDKYWTKSGTNAKYNFDTAAGWTINSESDKITYTAPKTTNIATITNLNIGNVVEGKIAGITATDYKAAEGSAAEVPPTIKLDKSVLGTAEIKLTNNYLGSITTPTEDQSKAYGYKLTLETENSSASAAITTTAVPTTTTENKQDLFIDGTTATYKKYNTEYWMLDGESKTVTYNAPTTGTVLATISGLKAGTKAEDIVVTEIKDDSYPAKVTGYIFTLKAGVLNATNVKITKASAEDTMDYKLALTTSTAAGEKIDAPTISGQTWAISGGTATYKGNVTAGYELKEDGSELVYTAKGNGKVLATIGGLKSSGLTVSSDKQWIGVKSGNTVSKGLTISGKTVTVTEDVLDTNTAKKVQVTAGTNYKLALDESVMTQTKANEGVAAWRIEDTDTTDKIATAVYKYVTPAYYTLNANNEITYTAEVGSHSKGEILKITNLRSDLKMSDTDPYAIQGITITQAPTAEHYDVEGVESTKVAAKDGIIELSRLALGTDKDNPITLSITKQDNIPYDTTYNLALASGTAAPDIDYNTKPTWTVEDDTSKATLKGKTTEGWVLGSDSKSITYAPLTLNREFAVVTGLKKVTTVADKTKLVNQLSANTTTTKDVKTLTLTNDMLGTANLEIKTPLTESLPGYDKRQYEFALADAVSKDPSAKENGWSYTSSGTTSTYTYKTVTPAYYTTSTTEGKIIQDETTEDLNNDGDTDDKNVEVSTTYTTKVEYHAQDNNGAAIATISGTGLKTDLLSDNTYSKTITGITVTPYQAEVTANPDADPPVVGKDAVKGTITVTKDALVAEKDKTVTVTPANSDQYDVKLAANANPVKGTQKWVADTTNKGTYTYCYSVTAGWTIDENGKISYAPANTVDIIKLEGLKEDLTAAKLNAGVIITEAKAAVEDDPTTEDVDETQAAVKATITLKDSVLADGNVKLTNGKDINGNAVTYELALESDTLVTNPTTIKGWQIEAASAEDSTKVAKLYNYTPEGYTVVNETAHTLTYVKPTYTGNALATVSGLKQTLNPTNGKIDGIADVSGTEIKLSNGVLDGKDVTVTNGYTLALDTAEKITVDGVEKDNPGYVAAPKDDGGKWTIAAGSNKTKTATFTQTTAAGYTVDSEDNKIIYWPTEILKTTINNLKSTVVVGSNGTKIGINKGTTAAPDLQGIEWDVKKNKDYDPAPPAEGEDDAKWFGTFTLSKDVISNRSVTLTNSANGTTKPIKDSNGKIIKTPTNSAYTIALKEGDASTVAAPKWYKENNTTTALYRQTIAAGYALDKNDPTKIIYYGKDTPETVATVTGLKKDVAADSNGDINGIVVTAPTFDDEGNVKGNSTIKLDKSILTNSDVKVVGDKDNYTLELVDKKAYAPGEFKEKGKSAYWELALAKDKKSQIATLYYGETEGWELVTKDEDGNPIPPYVKYTSENRTAVLTIDGLSTTLKTKEDGSIDGIDISALDFAEYTPPAASGNVTETGSAEETEPEETKYKVSSGAITLSDNVLAGKTITLTNNNDGAATLDINGIEGPQYSGNYWYATGNGKAYYRFDTTAGYALNTEEIKNTDGTIKNTANTVLQYTPNATTVLATLSGLSKKVTTAVKVGKTTTNTGAETLNGIKVETATQTVTDSEAGGTKTIKNIAIKLTDTSILGSTVTLTPTGNKNPNAENDVAFKLALDGPLTIKPDNKWYLKTEKNKTTTATYKGYTSAGYSLSNNYLTATKSNETAGTEILKITGLKKGLTLSDIEEGIALPNDVINNNNKAAATAAGNVTIKNNVLGATTVSLSSGTYTYNDGTEDKTGNYAFTFSADDVTKPEEQTPYWAFSKGIATLRQTTTAGFTLNTEKIKNTDGTIKNAANTVLTYSKQNTPVVAKIQNLKTALRAFNNATDGGENVIATYENKGTAKKPDYQPVATAVKFDADTKKIIVNAEALTTKNVPLVVLNKKTKDTGEYKLELGDMGNINKTEEEVTNWVVVDSKKGTATFKQYHPLYYDVAEDKKSIIYHKTTDSTDPVTVETKKGTTIKYVARNFATVTGIKGPITTTTDGTGNFTVNTVNDSNVGGVLTLNSTNFKNKNIALSGTGYTLKIANDDETKKVTSSVTNTSWAATTSKGVAVLNGTRGAGYEMAFGQKNITYIKSTKTQAVVSVSGLSASASVSADSNGVIMLDSNDVNKKSITLASALGNIDYTLDLDSTVENNTPTVDTENLDWGALNSKKKSVSLIGGIKEGGYLLSASGKSVTYIGQSLNSKKKYTNQAAIATVTGVKEGGLTASSFNASTREINLAGSELNSVVAVSGGAFSVKFDSDYNNSAITGSKAADNISVEGSGLTITGGKGDDAIDLGSGTKNAVVYANGDGFDVINGFNPGDDQLHVTKGTIAIEHFGDDILVKVGNGRVTLKDAYTKDDAIDGMNLTIYGKTNDTVGTQYFVPDNQFYKNAPGASDVLLEDNNYSADAANLSEMVEPHAATYTPYDFDSSLSLTKEDKLTSAAVTYSGDSNKK